MKKRFKSTIKCLLISTCMAGVGAFMFASSAYAYGSIQSEERDKRTMGDSYDRWDGAYIGEDYHSSRGRNNDTLKYADHATTEWQELGSSTDVRDSAFYEKYPSGTGDYGVSWSTDGVHWGNDDLYVCVGQTVTFRFNMHSENVGNHYANLLKGWIDWNTDADSYAFDDDNDVVSGFKIVRDSIKGSVSSDYIFDSGHDNSWEDDYGDNYWNRDDKGYGNDNETFTYSHVISESDFGTAYLRARVTCSDSLGTSVLGSNYTWGSQWSIFDIQYQQAFSAYADYYQGEIEDWMFTVSEKPPGSPVPEPTTLALFGMGLIGLAGVGRKKA